MDIIEKMEEKEKEKEKEKQNGIYLANINSMFDKSSPKDSVCISPSLVMHHVENMPLLDMWSQPTSPPIIYALFGPKYV